MEHIISLSTNFISYNLFPLVLNMSLTASLVILFVMLCRRFLKNAPKIFSYALWGVVLFRLLCPVSFSSDISLVALFDPPSTRSQTDTVSMTEYIPTNLVHTAYPRVELPFLPEVSESINDTLPSGREQTVADPLEAPVALTTLIWLLGIGIFLVYSVVSYLKLRFKLVGSTPLHDNIQLADHITSPFVMGLFRPKIYLPSSLTEQEQRYIILHEQHHIRRLDHIVKVFSFAALCIHWFNPLVWLAFVLSSKDMEMSCDEAVIKKLGPEIRADYSASLLTFATGKRIFSATPLAFGEGDTGSRIKNLAKWKKAGKYVTFVSLFAVVCIALFCAANGTGESWVKAKIENGPSFSFTANLEKPIVSWTIYEDIYKEGALTFSTARLTVDIPENAGSSERRFAGSILIDREILSNRVSVSLTCFGTRSWQFTLPLESYTGSGYTAHDGKTSSGNKRSFDAGDDIVLASAVFSANPEGSVNFPGIPTDIISLNHTVVQYRLSTSTSPSVSQEATDGIELPIQQPSGQLPASSSIQTWFDAFSSPSTAYPEEEQFMKLSAFPDTSFRITTDHRLIARKDGRDSVLIEGMPIWNVYLCDLNGDEKPEFCATISVGSGLVDNRVIVYDYAAGESYSLDYRGLYNYALAVEGSLLCVIRTDYRSGEITGNGPLRLRNTADEGGSFLYIGGLLQQLPSPAPDPLEEAIASTIQEQYRAVDLPDGLFHCTSHITLDTQTVYPGSYRLEEGYRGEQVTAYVSTLAQSYSFMDGNPTLVSSTQKPVVITLEKTAAGNYTLVSYRAPNEGKNYESDVRAYFPDHLQGDALNGDRFFPLLMQKCTRKVVDFYSLLSSTYLPSDPFHLEKTVNGLLDIICSSPTHSSNPNDYIAAHPKEYSQLEGYGQYTLYYFFSRFLKGGETGLEGEIMWSVCVDIMFGWGEDTAVSRAYPDRSTPQAWFDAFRASSEELAQQYSSTEFEQLFPGSWILLNLLEENNS